MHRKMISEAKLAREHDTIRRKNQLYLLPKSYNPSGRANLGGKCINGVYEFSNDIQSILKRQVGPTQRFRIPHTIRNLLETFGHLHTAGLLHLVHRNPSLRQRLTSGTESYTCQPCQEVS